MLSPEEIRLLDKSIQAGHEALRDSYARALSWATILVLVGCSLEIPEVFHEIWPRLIPERRVRPIKIISTVGLLLLIVGIAGELVFESRTEEADGIVQTFNEILLSDAQLRIAEANERAGDARDSAKTAFSEAQSARLASSNAVGSAKMAVSAAGSARKEAESFERDIVFAKSLAADAESHLADALSRAAKAEEQVKNIRSPRSLANPSALKLALSPFKGTEYAFNTFQDDESIQFTKSLDEVLYEAGWVRSQPPGWRLGVTRLNIFSQDPKDSVEVCAGIGIQIQAPSTEPVEKIRVSPVSTLPKIVQAASALTTALHSGISPADERNTGGIGIERQSDGPMLICVGRKP